MSETIVKDILGNVSFINMGQSPDSIYYNEEGNGLPLIQGNADIKERKSIKRFYTSQITKVCDEGDILMTVRAPVGYVGVASFQSCVGRGVCSIKAYGVDSKYLFYLLIQNEDKWKSLEAGTTFSAVTSKEVYNFPLLLTKSKTEQRQIAKILSTCDAVIEKTQAAIAKYKAIKQGMLQDLFTRGIDLNTKKLRPRYQDAPGLYKESKLGWIPREWEVLPVSSVSENLDGARIPVKQEDRDKQQEVYPYYGASGIIDYVEDYIFDESLILLGEDGENVISRNLPLAFKVSGKIWVNNHAHVLKPIPTIVTIDFLCEMLESINYSTIVSGTAQPKITQGALSEVLLPIPNMDEQLLMSERIVSITKKLQTEQTYLQKMQSIKKGLMEDLLSGKKQVKVTEEVNA